MGATTRNLTGSAIDVIPNPDDGDLCARPAWRADAGRPQLIGHGQWDLVLLGSLTNFATGPSRVRSNARASSTTPARASAPPKSPSSSAPRSRPSAAGSTA